MVVKLSSRGQLVIPKEIRDRLMLQPGTELDMALFGNGILIRPIEDKERALAAIDAMYGLFADTDILATLEAEHKWEIERDERRVEWLRS